MLRFAGDALYCSWSLPSGSEADGTLALAALAACRCALELGRRCGSYLIPEIDAALYIHSGIGVGSAYGYRVGKASRWEFLIAGDPLRQSAEAEAIAKLGQVVCSREAWQMVSHACTGEECVGAEVDVVRLVSCSHSSSGESGKLNGGEAKALSAPALRRDSSNGNGFRASQSTRRVRAKHARC